jgi:hypothetical protein
LRIRTYLSTGLRLAFSPGVRDENKLAMGGDEFIETLPLDLKAEALEVARQCVRPDPLAAEFQADASDTLKTGWRGRRDLHITVAQSSLHNRASAIVSIPVTPARTRSEGAAFRAWQSGCHRIRGSEDCPTQKTAGLATRHTDKSTAGSNR